MSTTQIEIQDEGTIVVLWPTTPEAEQWLAEHLGPDCPRWGTNGFAVERRYVGAILRGAERDGMLPVINQEEETK